MKILLFANTDWYLYNFRLSLLIHLRDSGHEVVLVSPKGEHSGRLQELGFRWMCAPMLRRSLNPLRELQLVRWLRDLIELEQPDLLHGFTIKCAVYGSIAARWTGVASVHSVAGLGYVFTNKDMRARILRPVVRRLLIWALNGNSSRVILQNPDDVKLFEREGIVNSLNLRLIPSSGVDCDRFAPDATPAAADRPLRVLLPARLLWDKGLAEFVAAAKTLLADGRRIDFLLAGAPDPGNPAAVPGETVRSWVNAGLLEWLGHVDDMPALFRSVDVVVLPSYREGLPKGLIEAGACGRALVTTDAPGCREVVADGVDGLIVPVKDSGALARAIARLADDPELRTRFGEAARLKVKAMFDERIVIARTVDIYKELVRVA